MQPESFVIHCLIKGEDLNHHGSVFAGRVSEWLVEAGFVAVASVLEPKNIVCAKVFGVEFRKPIWLGQVLRFESRVVKTGRVDVVTYVSANIRGESKIAAEGFMTFVNVDENTKVRSHGLFLDLINEEDIILQQRALSLLR